ncbi:cysteine hydrolase family protein [Pseudomonas aeruginosa]|jgi:nicotinamidase-related amidase|uniref:cysteine hydrolase family protein n=1 Tax=Pseudomonas aeruginosa TaxID=287 RepID=UPI000596B064|nr:Isochorismatase [Stutzerimonas stutzeri]MDI3617369.1 cysteine hydrolase family protein [Pseudomonas aeruginosa]MDI4030694.1 cysteine hydrolase family protein [Pseudomonas aeruginosa]HDQ4574559.1 cysteine hydrolase [Pseudomonas aeruginosa]
MSKCAVVVIDLQNEYLPTGKLPLSGIESAVANAAKVIADARAKDIPVIHVRHEFAHGEMPVFVPGSDGVQIQTAVAPQPGEPVVLKNYPNSFRETNLKQLLDERSVEKLVVVGAMSHMCVDAGVRAAADMGYAVNVIHDACATLDLDFNGVQVPAAQVHAVMMAALGFAYASLASTAEYLAG